MKKVYMNISLPENKADYLVKQALMNLGYSKEVEITRYLLDDDKINYYIYNKIMYHGKETKILTILSCTAYMNYLKEALEELENEIHFISPKLERGKLNYNVSFSPKSKGKIYRKR